MTTVGISMALDQALQAAWRDDGVVCLRGVLSPETLNGARAAFDWSLAHPGPGAARLPSKGSGTFYQDLANPAALAAYRDLLLTSEIGDLAAGVWNKPDVWFMYEQVFEKSGGTTRRTPWHQDAPYLPVRGEDLAVLWISFDPVPAHQALEFVRGSHRGTLYDGSRFDPEDDTAPIYGNGALPRLPDIEANRRQWPIVSWPTDPGDVLLFHPAVLHGGAATDASSTRRTLSLRFFGEDAVVAQRAGATPSERRAGEDDPAEHPLTRMRRLADGTPFRDPQFLRIRPRSAAA
ncbi:MAG: phytanoyl-CoA dioxygenase family protein [Pseudomonadales bacterium]